MTRQISIYNSLTRQKEIFKPLTDGHVGMYVCGPTVYSDVHLGNCRTFVSFDVIYRYLLYIGYQVRYVRNITDVGHLLDDGEDRMLKGAKTNNLEPMEVAQKYTVGFHDMMRIFNTLPPSIEPRATGHIIEQIEMVQVILDNGYAYIKNGSVYFDTLKFAEATGEYGKLSGRIIDDLIAESRDNLKNQDEKNHPSDFAIWMKATEEHIMKWNSPWSVGFPGWHLECSAMSTKYLGKKFDIHGGGNDLKFPHHENEIAQNIGSCGCHPASYWLHTNMLLMNGKKMSKSDGNTISPVELFTGDSTHVTKGYSPMVVRFFMLQSHYRSPNDLTDEALSAAEKGYKRLMEAFKIVKSLSLSGETKGALDEEIVNILDGALTDMDDDFNTPRSLARLFELVSIINSIKDNKIDQNQVSKIVWEKISSVFHTFIIDIFGLKEDDFSSDSGPVDGLMQLIIELRQNARENKDWPMSDKIRHVLNDLNIVIKDGKDQTSWTYK
ncbi:MAG: cysteine--tRNA ligase [Saprospiraceae bacterium]|nr:cysteine--tRNA ligase [Saprospiraceae bacterium]MBK6783377.1 cysteine--tRNA ligase [Saprospiraceae bacterium]MBK8372784.1 cysteine--tRNA ligase [Saprospiraceae bacterium]MBK8549088.1 cysteine--tRNA ligase [Saprospiraceae bacterium]MBK8855502.1 cysteine--tRNA ligase [Saprospiraceae bacterium]